MTEPGRNRLRGSCDSGLQPAARKAGSLPGPFVPTHGASDLLGAKKLPVGWETPPARHQKIELSMRVGPVVADIHP